MSPMEIYALTLKGPDNRNFVVEFTKEEYEKLARGQSLEIHLNNVQINSHPPVNFVISVAPVPTRNIQASVEYQPEGGGRKVQLSGTARIGSRAFNSVGDASVGDNDQEDVGTPGAP